MFYTFPYLGIIFVPMIVFYYIAALYYRRSSVEMKRLDSLLRSILYASYSGESDASSRLPYGHVLIVPCPSETLTGLSTVRAYRSQVSIVLPVSPFADGGPDIPFCSIGSWSSPSKAWTSRTERTT